MRLYWEVAKRGYRRYSTYRGATFAGAFTNTVFGFIIANVLLAVYDQREVVGGFDATDAVTFAFVGQGYLALVNVFGWRELGLRIASGDVVIDLYRPIDLQVWWLSHELGRAAFQAVFRGLPPFLVGAVVFHLRVPTDPAVIVTFVAATVLAVVTGFAFWFLVNLAAFWILDLRGPVQLASVGIAFLSGQILPLVFYPDAVAGVIRLLPWAGMVQLPIEVFLGKHEGGELVGVLGLQAFWIVVLLGAGRALLGTAHRRLVVQGG